jgi:alpha-beta hydrolase superfamily lysophospholipase
MLSNKKLYLFFLITILVLVIQGCGGPPLKPWHTEKLDEEFTFEKASDVKSFDDYLKLEDRLFQQLDQKVYAQSETGPEHGIDRYSPGSAADPRKHIINWNRSFELSTNKPRGAVLLLHGLSDSPYSLRSIGKALNKNNYWVLGLRVPGHGTAPSGLRFVNRNDMTAAVRLGMRHLNGRMKGKPVHIVGYSTGATLALEFSLDALKGKTMPVPSSLVLISPAIGVHPSAGLASFKNWMANLPGLDGLAYLGVQPEFDPYKYNSFATNAGDVVHGLTRSVASRIKTRASKNPAVVLPPTLVFKSTVDATVSTNAVVDNLLKHLKPGRHEFVLFDINRFAVVKSRMLIDDPSPLTDRVMDDAGLPFAVTLVTNESSTTRKTVSKYKKPFSTKVASTKRLGLNWPVGIVSLSHVALPISPLDSLYGQYAPKNDDVLYLGNIALRGERGLIRIPTDWMLRLRFNPFYDYVDSRLLGWIDNANVVRKKNSRIELDK